MGGSKKGSSFNRQLVSVLVRREVAILLVLGHSQLGKQIALALLWEGKTKGQQGCSFGHSQRMIRKGVFAFSAPIPCLAST